MPIPEVTVAASLECVSSEAPAGAVQCDGDLPDEKQTPVTSTEWEEPHPGQRYVYTVTGSLRPGSGGCNHACNGANRVGMAAKVYTPYPGRGWQAGARRFARPRLRTPSLKSHKKSANCQEGSKEAARLSVHTALGDAPNTAAATAKPISYAASAMSRLCGDESGGNGTAARRRGPAEATAAQQFPMCLTMTDFSGFLQSSTTDDSASSSASTVATAVPECDAGAYIAVDDVAADPCSSSQLAPLTPSLSPDEDPYGWEAELGKRLRSPGGGDCFSGLQYRRAGGSKRTLLQRVLSLSPRE